jgi:hypothetical protein
LSRLGTWQQSTVRAIDHSGAPLLNGEGRVSHVALVYSHLQDQAPRPGSSLETAVRAGVSLGHYTTVKGLVSTVFEDVHGLLQHHGTPPLPATSVSLRTRIDTPQSDHHLLQHVFGKHDTAALAAPSGPLATLRALEDDVAAYVCRNDLRERVRAFVRDALHRLCYREDVDAVIINAHSNGTVIGFDVLRQLTPIAADKVKWFVTAGSPLRKYIDLFCWGTDVGSMRDMGAPKGWTNFWDERDPVADPISPPIDWLRGHDLPVPTAGVSLFQQVSEKGATSAVPITDESVDNIDLSTGGGLQAHNYWDNEEQVVQRLAEIIRALL